MVLFRVDESSCEEWAHSTTHIISLSGIFTRSPSPQLNSQLITDSQAGAPGRGMLINWLVRRCQLAIEAIMMIIILVQTYIHTGADERRRVAERWPCSHESCCQLSIVCYRQPTTTTAVVAEEEAIEATNHSHLDTVGF